MVPRAPQPRSRARHGQTGPRPERAEPQPSWRAPADAHDGHARVSTPTLLGPLFGTAEASSAFADGARLQGMLDFEAALARAQARLGVIPSAAAPAIAAKARAELFDAAAIGRAAARAGNPAIPLVRRLTALVAEQDEAAARFVHWGATSQDAMDTGLVLQLRAFLGPLEADLGRLATALARLGGGGRGHAMVGRAWLQQAVPLTAGPQAPGRAR